MSLHWIKTLSIEDPEVVAIRQASILEEWYKPYVKQFDKMKLEFTENNEIVLWGSRIFITASLRNESLTNSSNKWEVQNWKISLEKNYIDSTWIET